MKIRADWPIGARRARRRREPGHQVRATPATPLPRPPRFHTADGLVMLEVERLERLAGPRGPGRSLDF